MLIEQLQAEVKNLKIQNDNLNAKEIYDGSKNPIVVELEKKMSFFCDFNSIESYPFGVQTCNFSFSLSGHANKVTLINKSKTLLFNISFLDDKSNEQLVHLGNS